MARAAVMAAAHFRPGRGSEAMKHPLFFILSSRWKSDSGVLWCRVWLEPDVRDNHLFEILKIVLHLLEKVGPSRRRAPEDAGAILSGPIVVLKNTTLYIDTEPLRQHGNEK